MGATGRVLFARGPRTSKQVCQKRMMGTSKSQTLSLTVMATLSIATQRTKLSVLIFRPQVAVTLTITAISTTLDILGAQVRFRANSCRVTDLQSNSTPLPSTQTSHVVTSTCKRYGWLRLLPQSQLPSDFKRRAAVGALRMTRRHLGTLDRYGCWAT